MNRFINCMRAVTLAVGSLTAGAGTANIAHAETGWPEKAELTIGFIKLTDMAPLA
ncbi:MAG TPA: nitrate ABC transporter substrate-binding protein, partial [Pseudohongiella sp.]|nr:nitrate ABC transporter substrate-binding protein [Pseudohongiella sp.]